MDKIAIIGAGELGQALGQILTKDGRKISFWDRNDAQLQKINLPVNSLPDVVSNASFVFLCIPSWSVKEVLAIVCPYLFRHTIVVLMSKGIDRQTGKLPYEIAKKLLPATVDFAVLSGAMIAEDLSNESRGAGIVSAKLPTIGAKVVELFRETSVSISFCADLKGVAWVGVLKNIYALGLGMVEALGWSMTERSILFGQSFDEMLRLIKVLGGKKETVLAWPSLADFVATGFSPHSYNHRTGLDFGRMGQTDKRSEGVSSLVPLLHHFQKEPKEFPILLKIAQVVVLGEDPKKVFEN